MMVKHLFEVHCYEPSFMYACNIEQCPRAFSLGSTYSSFLSHANRKHPNWRQVLDATSPIRRLQQPCLQSTIEIESSNDDENDGGGDDDDHMDYSMPDYPTYDNEDDGISDSQKAAAQFLLTLRERYKLSQTAVDFAVGAVNQIISALYEEMKTSITKILDDRGISVPDLFVPAPLNPFEGLETEYKQAQFYKDHFGLVVIMITSFSA